MSDVEYSLAVADVKDLIGNPIASPEGDSAPSLVKFTGIPPGKDQLVDTDGDGVTDDVEQRGWVVTVYKLDGSTLQRSVNSDPLNPDTDGDGVSDQYELTYRLDGPYERFVAVVGIDDAVRPGGDAELTVLGDGKPLGPPLRLRGADKARTLRLGIAGVRELTLRAGFGRDGLDVADHVDLAAPRLIKPK